MLRAVRFAARFGYTIDEQTFAAIRELAPQIHQVSRERVRDEILKMLTEGHARRAFELLDQTNLLEQVLPEIKKMQGVAQPPQYHPEGDVWIHTLMLLEGLPAGCSKTLALGALLHDVGKPPTFRVAPDRIRFDGHAEIGTKMAAEICRRFRLSNDDTDQVLSLVANHMRFGDVQRMKDSTLKRFFRLPQFEQHLELHRLDCQSSHRDLSLYDFAEEKFHTLPAEQIRPQPLITGADLIAAGYKPGPAVQRIADRRGRRAAGWEDQYEGRGNGVGARQDIEQLIAPVAPSTLRTTRYSGGDLCTTLDTINGFGVRAGFSLFTCLHTLPTGARRLVAQPLNSAHHVGNAGGSDAFPLARHVRHLIGPSISATAPTEPGAQNFNNFASMHLNVFTDALAVKFRYRDQKEGNEDNRQYQNKD